MFVDKQENKYRMSEFEPLSKIFETKIEGFLIPQTIDRIIDSFPAQQQGQVRLQLSSSLVAIFSMRLIPRISGGLVPAYELLINNTAVSNLIREKRTYELRTVIETSSELGMIDMNRSLADLVRRGEVSPENAFARSTNPEGLERLL